MQYPKAVKEVAFDFEQKIRQALSDKYTSYMTSAYEWELGTLAKLVDIRLDDNPKYSHLTVQVAFDWANDIIDENKKGKK